MLIGGDFKMKKNVKYIGSAVAVALLAAGSPVVIHSLIPTIEVKADDTQVDSEKEAAIEYFTKFKNQYGTTRYASSFKNLAKPLYEIDGYNFGAFPYFNAGGKFGGGALIYDFNHDYNFETGLSLLKEYVDPDVTFANSNDTVHLYQNVTAYISVSDPDSKNNPATSTHPAGAEELSTGPALKAFADKLAAGTVSSPLTITIHLGSANNDADANKILSYLPDDLKTFSVNFTKSSLNLTNDTDQDLTVATGTTGDDARLQPADGASTNSTLKVTDNYALNDIDAMSAIQKPHYGKSLYSSQEAALKAADTDTFNPNATDLGSATTNPGTYYQTISYQLLSDTDTGDDALNHAVLGTPDPKSAGAILEPYETNIDGKLGTNGTDYVLNKNTGYLTIVRAVDVGGTIAPNFDPSVSVGLNDKKSTIDPKDYTIKNGNRNISSSVTTNGEYYTDPGASTTVSAKKVSDDTFLEPGTYYRKITFTLNSGNISDYYKIYGNDIGKYTTNGNEITYIQEVNVKNVAKSIVKGAKANVGDPISVSTATDGNDITDKDGKSLLVKSDSNPDGVSFGTDYYDISPTDANKQAILNDPTKVGQPTADVVKDGVFNKAGTYLRTITFYLTQQDIANNTFNGDDPNVKVSKANSTVTYVQTITINPNEVTPTINDVHTIIGTSVTDSGLHDSSTVELPNGDDSLLDKTKGDNNSGISFGNVYYDDSTLNNTTNDISTTNKLTTAKTYHRLVTFYLTDTAYDQSQFKGSYTHSDQDKSVSYVQNVIVDPSTKTATFGNHDLEVPYNTATNSSTLTGTSDYTLADDDGSTGSIEDHASLDGNYYASEADAKAGTNALTVANLTDSTYYRVITIKVKSGDGYLYSYPGASSVDAENDEVQYIQKVSVDKEIATINVSSGTVVSGNTLSTVKSGTNTITDSSGKTISTGVVGTTYYDDVADAINNSSDTSSRIIKDGSLRVTGPEGTMYRTVTFTLNNGAGNYTFKDAAGDADTDNPNYKVEGNTITYAQPISITVTNVSQAAIKAKTVDMGSNPENIPTDIKYYQNVSYPNDPEKHSDIVITHKSGFMYVSLVNETGKLQFGTTYYDKDAYDKGDKKVVDVLDADGDFNKAGSFYREVTIPLKTNYDVSFNFDINKQYVSVDTEYHTVTYLQEIDVNPITVNANVAGPTVASGSSTTDSSVTSTDGINLVDGSNKSLTDIPVQTVGTTYYTSKAGALANDGKTDVATDATSDNGTVFNKAATYYRTITFKPADGTIDEYTSADPETVKVNADGTITYAQAITVGKGDATVKIDTPRATVGQSVNDSSLKDSSDITLNDKSIVVPGSITYGDNYYRSAVDCLGDNRELGTIFDKADTENGFYRRITFTLKPNVLDNVDLSNNEYQVVRNSDGTATVTYVQNVLVDPASAEVSVADPIEVTAGTNESDEQNSDNEKSNNKITSNGVPASKSVSFGKYYDVNLDPSDIVNGKATATDGVVNNDKFVKKGTFYRTVIFELNGDAANISLPDTTPHHVEGNTVTYVQKVTIDPIEVSVTAPTSPSFASVLSTSDSSVTDTTGISLNDGKIAEPVLGTTYYTSKDAALVNDGKTNVATDATTADGKNFSTAGTYFRTVTFTPAAGTIGEYSSDDSNVKVNDDGTITYAQSITVGKNNASDSDSIANLTVKVNVNGDNSALTSTEGYTLTDKYGNNLIDTTKPNKGISFSSDYIDKATGKPVSTVVASGAKITKAGTYTRQVIFNVTDEAIENNDFTAIGGKLDKDAKTVTFTQTVIALTNPAVSLVTNPSVSSGTNAGSDALKDPKDVSITDGAGNSIVSGTPTFSGIFKTSDGAKNNTPAGGDATGNLPAGTYYQKVTIPLNDNADNAYDFGTDAKVDKINNTVSYIRTITVKQSTSGGGSSSEGDDDEWTYYKDPGVVTTKTDQDYYYINHKDNSIVANRTLGKDSSWITDQYRTNRAGVKQYRVATDEWVDARYVYFLDKSTDNNNDDEWTYFKAPGIVTTKTNQDYYNMNHKDDSAVENRALAEDSSWITDQYRTNREGVKQYRVATDEWIDSNSVIFTQNVINGISSIKGVVNLDETNAYYMLYTKEGNIVSNRALKKKSSWLVDEIGRDAQGNVYYRVASNEWVKVVPGVYFDNKAWY